MISNPSNIDPRQLRTVLAVVQHGTFSRAADALGLCQPALSKSISLLERKLGVKLFDRGARGAKLTEMGQIVARRAESMDLLLTRMQEEIHARLACLDGPLKIGAVPSMMHGLVPETLIRTLQSHAHLKVEVREDMDDILTPALRRGEIDFLIGPIETIQSTPPDLVETKLADEQLFIILPPNHPLSGKKQVHLADLRNEAWVLPLPGGSFHRLVEAFFISAGIPFPEDAIFTNRQHIHMQLIENAGRVSIAAASHLFGITSDIKAVPLAGTPTRSIGIKHRKGARFSPAAEQFIRDLTDVAAIMVDQYAA